MAKLEVVISGASRGLGKCIAFGLVPLASKLWLLASSDSPALQATADAISAAHPHLSGSIELAHFDANQLWASGAAGGGAGAILRSRGCEPSILINNSGGWAPGTMLESDPDALQKMLSMNLLGAHELTRALLPGIVKKQGMVVNVSSVAARGGSNGSMAYGISKHALSGFSKNLREEMKGKNVRVTTVYPGTMDTSRWQAEGAPGAKPTIAEGQKPVLLADDVADMIVATVKLGKGANVEEIILDSV
jgi:short-subunit dehydrogenase